MEKNLSPRQAAVRLGVGLQFVYLLLYDGKLAATKLGNRSVIPESSVVERLRRLVK